MSGSAVSRPAARLQQRAVQCECQCSVAASPSHESVCACIRLIRHQQCPSDTSTMRRADGRSLAALKV